MNPIAYHIISIALAVITFGVILYFGLKTDILRESLPNVQMNKRMFSMGRFQLWVWTLVICPVFILFWGFSYSHGIDMNTTSVILLGIPAGVALTSNVISSSQSADLDSADHIEAQVSAQNSKSNAKAQAEAISRAVSTSIDSPTSEASPNKSTSEKAEPIVSTIVAPSKKVLKMHQVSKSFFIDLISGDDGQLSLGRLQQLIFTMVFLVIYVSTFFSSEMSTLPDFGAQVFTLMGISSGTYLVSKGMNK